MKADPRITENIKKLKELGMSKEDIVENLVKMGLSSEDSEELIESVFGTEKKTNIQETPKEIKNEKEITFTKSEIPDNLFSDEAEVPKINLKKLPPEKEKKNEIPDITKGLDLSGLDYTSNKEQFSLDNYDVPIFNDDKIVESASTTDLWQTGLVTTINTKINEVEIRQKKMEEYLKRKIDAEIDKFKKIQDTSNQLMIGKIGELITEQISGVSTQFTKQLAQLKVEQVKINKKSEEIKVNKQEIDNLIVKMQEFQAQITQNNKSNQNNVNKLIATTTVKLNTKIKEINDILALQSKITQGLIKNTQGAVVDEVKKLNTFKDNINKQINPQQLYDKLNQLESFKQQLANRYEQRFDVVKDEFLKKAREAFKDEIKKELTEINKVKDTIVAKTDPEIITKKLKELSNFETQLVNAIDDKISQTFKIYESAASQEISNKIKKMDAEIKKIDDATITIELAKEKVNELNMFKDQFIAIIDKNIEKINNTYEEIDKKIKTMEERQKLLI